MIDLKLDTELEEAFKVYKKLGNFMPVISLEYNNSMAFNTRKIGGATLNRKTIRRAASARFMKSGRVVAVEKAKFNRNIEQIESRVGGRVVPTARDPNFMERLEKGGKVPKDKFGNVGLPTIKGARGGSASKIVPTGLTVPKVAATAVGSRNVKGSARKKRAVAIAIAIRERKSFARMNDTKGRDSLYRVKGKGRGKKRRANTVVKLWTLSRQDIRTAGKHWLSESKDTAVKGRVKTFNRIAERRYQKLLKKRR